MIDQTAIRKTPSYLSHEAMEEFRHRWCSSWMPPEWLLTKQRRTAIRLGYAPKAGALIFTNWPKAK